MASTKAARVKVGYKDLMMANTAQDGIMDKNYNVRVQDNFDFVDCELDVVLLKSGGFNSGIPFYFKNPSVTANKKVMANFLKIGDSANNYYLPFNTISRNCEFNASMDPNVKLNFSCNLENKNGVNVFKIFFQVGFQFICGLINFILHFMHFLVSFFTGLVCHLGTQGLL